MFTLSAVVFCAFVAQTVSHSLSNGNYKRFEYLGLPIARYTGGNEGLRENLARLNEALRQKRFEGAQDYSEIEDPYTKRTSLKRLAILSARGFGKK
ncbi:unnamed protein product [Cylicocyclus nassatus]|uniref:Uncharacterized protein n=1 Tax=Cylicocyclus nassatus TaxID=53992 RepID=A0AA36DS17_CYLNA|nr:unnamed protein product [Cylicocyclus nassatus]